MRNTRVLARMVVSCSATMRLLHDNNGRTVRRSGESGGVEHAGQAPCDEQYDKDKPKDPAPSQVAVMFDQPAHRAIQLRTETSVLDVDQAVLISVRT